MHKLFLTGALATLFVASGFGQAKLTGFSATKAGDGVQIQVKGDNLGTPAVVRSHGIYALEFKGKLVGRAKAQKVGYGGVNLVKSVWYKSKPSLVRVAVKARKDSKFSFVKNDQGWLLSVNTSQPTFGSFSETMTATMPVFKPFVAPKPAAEPVKEEPKAQLKAEPKKEAPKVEAKKEEPKALPKVEVKKAAPNALEMFLASAPVATPMNVVASSAPKTDGWVTKKQKEPQVKITTVKTSPMKSTVASSRPVAYQSRVSLDFVNTDIVQILKALAMQANVNIVTSPDVKGNLTVSLHNVSVSEALDLVTTLAGVRYAKVGKTFVVTSDAKFTTTMRILDHGSVPMTSETRVVPIYSGEGTQIKAAMLKSAPMEEGVELVLPSEEITVETTDAVTAESGAEPTTGGETETSVTTKATTGGTGAKTKKSDPYVVLIGPTSKLEKFEKMVRAIDEQICRALGMDYPTTSAMVRKMYRPRGSSAATLLAAVSGDKGAGAGVNKAKIGNVEAFATPSSSISDQAIVLWGRETEVNQLLLSLENIDTIGQDGADYLVYEVKFLEPKQLMNELMVQVPGINVSLTSSAVTNPGASAGQSSGDAGVAPPSVGGVAPSSSDGGSSGSSDEGSAGLGSPYKGKENTSYPMRLILRGNKDQIQRALSYASVVDIAPQQVAIELRVLNITREESLRAGLDFGLLTSGAPAFVNSSSNGTIDGAVGIAPGVGLTISATLDQLSTNGRLVARPNLLATDGRESETFVGNIVRYVKSVQVTQTGTSIETGEVPVGVRFAVLPRIGGDGNITLDMRPSVSTLNGFTQVGNGAQLPQTGNRISQNTVVMKDGDTVAIGGLIQDQDSKSVGGIPILKDLPIIGMLFRRTINERVRTETVFFVTARIVNRGNAATAANPTSFTPTSGLTDKVDK